MRGDPMNAQTHHGMPCSNPRTEPPCNRGTPMRNGSLVVDRSAQIGAISVAAPGNRLTIGSLSRRNPHVNADTSCQLADGETKTSENDTPCRRGHPMHAAGHDEYESELHGGVHAWQPADEVRKVHAIAPFTTCALAMRSSSAVVTSAAHHLRRTPPRRQCGSRGALRLKGVRTCECPVRRRTGHSARS
jgi:hypothetical protein